MSCANSRWSGDNRPPFVFSSMNQVWPPGRQTTRSATPRWFTDLNL